MESETERVGMRKPRNLKVGRLEEKGKIVRGDRTEVVRGEEEEDKRENRRRVGNRKIAKTLRREKASSLSFIEILKRYQNR